MPLPEPRGYPTRFGHLPRWAGEPLRLLTEGAALGSPFALRLGRKAVVGFTPEWNRMLLSDLETFRSRGSFSSLSPYLNGGIITTDAPQHRPRKTVLNREFHAGAVRGLADRLRAVIEAIRPRGDFEAGSWAAQVVQASLNAAYFASQLPPLELAAFLAPLKRPFPAALLPRPLLFSRMRRRVAQMQAEGHGIAAHLPLEEVLIGLAAGYDTTAHTLAWALWYAANYPEWHTPQGVPLLLKETLRLFPPGYVGSRVARRVFAFGGQEFPSGWLVLYSPYLTHRHPDLWPEPLRFDPGRFAGKIPAWGYLPFGGGERICLGMHFAQLVLEQALAVFPAGLKPIGGDPTPRPLLTLAPRGPLWLTSY
ncbi:MULTISPECIES: cytochrome P450 [unclassified Meiothermus]|uniref:cytochrome P450 n=1 Tax=unclassified Meiothermus TaxID=370471 RepID=UPI000D7D1E23|nr:MULTISPECIES: cytochrome P450 [unclassified Meiothermus]PZA08997.1 cytochrome P450 [Meiothermus sp. Pnk-1]RYM36306.1 cytochrome P450 [Meiothermus sp. PNK-Is4]